MPEQKPPVKHTKKRTLSEIILSGYQRTSGQMIPVTKNNPQANDTVSIFHEQAQTLIKHYADYRGKLLKAVIDDDAKTLEDLYSNTTTINHFLDELSHTSDYHAMGKSTLCQYIDNSIAFQVLTDLTEERITFIQQHKNRSKFLPTPTQFKHIRENAFSTISTLCNQHPSTQAIEIRIATIKANIIRTDDNCQQLWQLLMDHNWAPLNQSLITLKQEYQEKSEHLNALYKANQALVGQSKLAVEQEKQSVAEQGILGLQWADGSTLLHYAAEENSKQVVIFLISQDSQLLFKADAQGNRPLAMLLKNTDEAFIEQVSSTALKAVSPQTLIDAVEEKSHERFNVLKENIASLLKGAENIAENDHTLTSNPETWEGFLYYTMFEKNYKALMQYRREEFSLFLYGLHDLLADYSFDKFSGVLRKIMSRTVLGPVPEDRDNWRNRRNFHIRIKRLYLNVRRIIEENAELYEDQRTQLIEEGIITSGAIAKSIDKDAVKLAGETIVLTQKVKELETLVFEEQTGRTEAESQNETLVNDNDNLVTENSRLEEDIQYEISSNTLLEEINANVSSINNDLEKEKKDIDKRHKDDLKKLNEVVDDQNKELEERNRIIFDRVREMRKEQGKNSALRDQLIEQDIKINALKEKYANLRRKTARHQENTGAAKNPNAFRYNSKSRSPDSENTDPDSKHQPASHQG